MTPKMRPPSLHSTFFFSSLKQVEKRLKLETTTPPQKQQQPQTIYTNYTSTESLSSPIYVHIDQEPNNNNSNSNCSSTTTIQEESSEPPLAFLSSSLHYFSHPTNQNPLQETPEEHPKNTIEVKTSDVDVDDIEMLMQLLGLSNCEEVGQEKVCRGCDDDWFYERIVGVDGPKCREEFERLQGWIRYFLRSDKEPLRLAFLLLGKAAFELECFDCDFSSLEFPSCIEDFLKFDPPRE